MVILSLAFNKLAIRFVHPFEQLFDHLVKIHRPAVLPVTHGDKRVVHVARSMWNVRSNAVTMSIMSAFPLSTLPAAWMPYISSTAAAFLSVQYSFFPDSGSPSAGSRIRFVRKANSSSTAISRATSRSYPVDNSASGSKMNVSVSGLSPFVPV